MNGTLRSFLVVLGLLALHSPASAQWTRVTDVPASHVFAVHVQGDTIVAGMAVTVQISTDAGASWKPSSLAGQSVSAVVAVLVRNGRLYAGTFGQGVFISDDLGDSWQGFNQGLVGGLFDTQLDLSDLQVRGDSLYAATEGAGVYVRSLAVTDSWHHFGEDFEPNQASNVGALAVGGTRLLAAAGGNGSVFFRDPGDAEWTISWLNNIGLHPGEQARSAAWTGTGWVVGSNFGVSRSVLGEEPWTRSGPGLGPLNHSWFATREGRLFAAFDIPTAAVIETSGDDGATWQEMETLPGVFVYKLVMVGSNLYAARADGLWRRSTAPLSVPGPGESIGLRFALVGAQPAGNSVRFRFDLPRAGNASIEVFDVTGRRAGDRVQGSWSEGTHEVAWSARDIAPGVYLARLTTARAQEVVRLVHSR